MYQIVIPKVLLTPTKLVDKTTGEVLNEQAIKITHPEMFGDVVSKILLRGGQKPYEPGVYECDPNSLQPGEYGRCKFDPKPGKMLRSLAATPSKVAA